MRWHFCSAGACHWGSQWIRQNCPDSKANYPGTAGPSGGSRSVKFYTSLPFIFQLTPLVSEDNTTQINILKTKNELLESKLNELLIEAGKTPI